MGENNKEKQYVILFGKPGKKKECPPIQKEILLENNILNTQNKTKKDVGFEIFEDTLEYKFDPYKETEMDETVSSGFFTSLKKIFMLFIPGKKKNRN